MRTVACVVCDAALNRRRQYSQSHATRAIMAQFCRHLHVNVKRCRCRRFSRCILHHGRHCYLHSCPILTVIDLHRYRYLYCFLSQRFCMSKIATKCRAKLQCLLVALWCCTEMLICRHHRRLQPPR